MSVVITSILISIIAATAAPPAEEAPVVVELFTSQSCSSCPPAEAFLKELAADPHVLAIEWHVDYWDDLIYGAAGKWKDPYSHEAHTRRQRSYNEHLRGRASVYTPQTVINGAAETVGSRRSEIRSLIASARPVARIPATRRADDVLFSIPQDLDPAETFATVVVFRLSTTTQVPRGENHGRTLSSAHIVTNHWNVTLSPEDEVVSAPSPKSGLGCALLLQSRVDGAITGAGRCPL